MLNIIVNIFRVMLAQAHVMLLTSRTCGNLAIHYFHAGLTRV